MIVPQLFQWIVPQLAREYFTSLESVIGSTMNLLATLSLSLSLRENIQDSGIFFAWLSVFSVGFVRWKQAECRQVCATKESCAEESI